MKLEVALNALAIVLFLGFGMAAMIAFSTIDKQREITVASRYGRQTGPLEILYVNIALLLVAFMLYTHNYRFMPTLIVFVLLIIFNSRMTSGLSPIGVFIGTTYIHWDKVQGYRIVNDEISTIEVLVYANKKRYALRCEKEYRTQVESYFEEHSIPIRDEEERHETFN